MSIWFEIGDRVVYSTEGEVVPVTYTSRADAPEIGDVFTAKVVKENEKRDLIINAIPYHTGYIRKNFKKKILVVSGKCYRFKIVGGPYQKKYHNFYFAIPLREIREGEDLNLNRIDGQGSLLIQRIAEFMLGIGWNRRKRRNYRLSESQRNWDWFNRNLI